ncbi:MAG: hypothetical protein IPH43_05100 [Xanthomonadales bacterium]|nr:hypothetical protein [Xanthomonadales bacterium]
MQQQQGIQTSVRALQQFYHQMISEIKDSNEFVGVTSVTMHSCRTAKTHRQQNRMPALHAGQKELACIAVRASILTRPKRRMITADYHLDSAN